MKSAAKQAGRVAISIQADYSKDPPTSNESCLTRRAPGAIFCNGRSIVFLVFGQSHQQVEWLCPAAIGFKTQMQDNMFQKPIALLAFIPATSFKAVCQWVLALEISPFHQDFVIWFRQRWIETVTVAANPISLSR